MRRIPALALVVLTGSGCATARATARSLPEAEITTDDPITEALLLEYLVPWFAVALVEAEGGDGTCPSRIELGASTLWAGSCVDDKGVWWPPGSKLLREQPDDLRARYLDFYVGEEEQARGRVRLWKDGDETRFTIVLKISDEDTGEVAVIDYQGRTTADLLAEHTKAGQSAVISGLGTFASSEYGKVEVLTFEKVYDPSRCASEPLSGITQLRASGHTVLITYDGAFDCDPEGLARWTLDGVPMGEIGVVTSLCSMTDDTRGWPLLVLIPVLAAARRRARRAPAR